MLDTPPSRRERLRAETSAEIKAIAMAQLAEGGPRAISLRSIARTMGMTAGAIYSYFDTRDDLIASLVADIYHDLAEQQEAARDLASGLGLGDQLLAVAESYRSWGLANPA